uniref:Uncharacterized protein n=1 Tax=Anguilla anguilla TaxID=7936 RepID=A0A0E9QIC9_ANGAN
MKTGYDAVPMSPNHSA